MLPSRMPFEVGLRWGSQAQIKIDRGGHYVKCDADDNEDCVFSDPVRVVEAEKFMGQKVKRGGVVICRRELSTRSCVARSTPFHSSSEPSASSSRAPITPLPSPPPLPPPTLNRDKQYDEMTPTQQRRRRKAYALMEGPKSRGFEAPMRLHETARRIPLADAAVNAII